MYGLLVFPVVISAKNPAFTYAACLSKGKVLIAYNNNQEIKFDDIKEKILINGQNAIDMTIINL